MKVVILAGGLGTRISEESHLIPKPMIEVGGKPILWHIMKHYTYYGFQEFIICCGYKQHIIKEYFANYYLNNGDITFDFSKNNEMTVHNNVSEQWKVTLVDTGLNTMTGGRLLRIKDYLNNEAFHMTYGDGVSDIDLEKLSVFHKSQEKLATLSTVKVEPRFGVVNIKENTKEVIGFMEKPASDDSRINGGFMILEPEVLDYIAGDETFFEREPLHQLAKKSQLSAFEHNGFWQCMDTQREKGKLETLWKKNEAPWKLW